MTIRILKSEIDTIPDFASAAQLHAEEMRQWREHQARVSADEQNGVQGIEKHWPLQRPGAHPLVERAINDNSDVDYEVVDDGPSPTQILRARKDELLNRVHQLEHAAIAAVVPKGKQRMFNLQENAVRTAHADRLSGDRGMLKSAAKAVGLRQDPEMPAGDKQFLADQAERHRRIAAINLEAAKAQHDIEDLTLDNIVGFKLPDFSGE